MYQEIKNGMEEDQVGRIENVRAECMFIFAVLYTVIRESTGDILEEGREGHSDMGTPSVEGTVCVLTLMCSMPGF